MKKNIFKIVFVVGTLVMMSIPKINTNANCTADLKNWFCHDNRFCMSGTDESNCNDGSYDHFKTVP